MKANVTIWEIDRQDKTKIIPVYNDVQGTYSNRIVDQAMVLALTAQFAHRTSMAKFVTLFNIGATNTTWAFVSDGAQGAELYIVRVAEL